MKAPDDPEVLTLCDPFDAWNFHDHEPMTVRQIRPSLRSRISHAVRLRLPWFFPRLFVSAIDREQGSITLSVERWSWRRWKWERR